MTRGLQLERHPARAGGLVSLFAATLATAAVADATGQLVALAGELVALLVFALGTWRLHDGDRPVGASLAVVGGLGVPAAIGYGVVAATQMTRILELVPGMVGLGVLALGTLPLRPRWSRVLVSAGAILVGVGLLVSGVVLEAGRFRLLAGMALVVIAWDAAEQAVNLGEQVGHRAASRGVVATHSAWSVGVGALGVAAASGVYSLDVTGLPLLGVGLLLLGLVAVAVAAFT